MSGYNVRVANVFDFLDENQAGSEKKKKKKKKGKKETSGDDEAVLVRGAVEALVTTDATADGADFEEPKRNVKKSKQKAKREAEVAAANAALAAEMADDSGESKRSKKVSFSNRAHEKTPLNTRRPSIKPLTPDAVANTDTGTAHEMVKLGYPLAHVVACMDALEKQGTPVSDTDALLEELQRMQLAEARNSLQSPDFIEPPMSSLGAKVASAPKSPRVLSDSERKSPSPSPSPRTGSPNPDEDAFEDSGGRKKRKKKFKKKDSQEEEATASETPAPAVEQTEQADGAETAAVVEESKLSPEELLEAEAKREIDGSAKSVQLVEKWYALLSDVTTAYAKGHSPSREADEFAKVFMNSRVVEVVLEAILRGKANRAPQRFFTALAKIMDLTVAGGHALHEWVLVTLRGLSSSLGASSKKEFLMSTVVELLAKQKLDLLDQEGHGQKHKPGANPYGERAEAALQKLKRPTLHAAPSGGDTNPLQSLTENANYASECVSIRQEAVEAVRNGMKKGGRSEDIQVDYFRAQKGLESALHELETNVARQQQQQLHATSEKERLRTEQEQELADLIRSDKQFSAERLALEERKRELESELRKVDKTLKSVQAAQDQNTLAIQAIKDSSVSKAKQLESSVEQIAFELALVSKDRVAVSKTLGFIGQVKDKVAPLVGQRQQILEADYHTNLRQYLQAVQEYVGKKQQCLNFLRNRIQFCTTRLEQTHADRENMRSLGLYKDEATDRSIETQMSDMLKADQALAADIKREVEQTLRKVASLVDTSLAAAASTGYEAFLRDLKSKFKDGTITFEVSMLPKLAVERAPSPLPKRSAAGAHGHVGAPVAVGFESRPPFALPGLGPMISPVGSPVQRPSGHGPVGRGKPSASNASSSVFTEAVVPQPHAQDVANSPAPDVLTGAPVETVAVASAGRGRGPRRGPMRGRGGGGAGAGAGRGAPVAARQEQEHSSMFHQGPDAAAIPATQADAPALPAAATAAATQSPAPVGTAAPPGVQPARGPSRRGLNGAPRTASTQKRGWGKPVDGEEKEPLSINTEDFPTFTTNNTAAPAPAAIPAAAAASSAKDSKDKNKNRTKKKTPKKNGAADEKSNDEKTDNNNNNDRKDKVQKNKSRGTPKKKGKTATDQPAQSPTVGKPPGFEHVTSRSDLEAQQSKIQSAE